MTEHRQPPIDSSDGVALLLTVDDVGVYIADGGGCRGLVGPVKEELEVTGVVTVGAGMRAFAPQPAVEFGDFRVHSCLLVIDFGNSTTRSNFARVWGNLMQVY
jgi:hypothetical protein